MAEATPEVKEKTPAAVAAASTNRTKSNAEHLFRFSTVDRDSADDDEKTIQVCFSSEELVLRKATEYDEQLGVAKKGTKYWELLSHRKGDADFSELDGGKGTVLDEHEDSLQLGKVPRAKRSKDSVGRAVLKFDGLSELSTTRYEQMKRGERTGISTGYWHTKFIGDEGEKEGHPIKRLAWAADEISSVRNAADKNRAGVRRSAEGQWACLDCGNMFDRAKLNENYECGCESDIRSKRDTVKDRKARKPNDFKFKRDAEDEISFSDLATAVGMAVDSDKRFKSKRPNGDLVSAFFVDDIILDVDTGDWSAVIFNWYDGTFFAVEFDLEDDETVTLGEAVAGTYESNFIPLDSSGRASAMPTKKRSAVDLPKLSEAEKPAIVAPNILTRKIMADKTPEQIAQEAIAAKPELVIDSLETPHVQRALKERGYRTKIELDAAAKTRDEKIAGRNKEILALETEFRSDASDLINHRKLADGKKEPFYVRDAIHLAAMEACAADDSKPDTEIRQIFRSKVDDLKRGAVSEENIKRAVADAEIGLAGRCDDVFAVIKRTLAESHSKGTQSRSLMPAGAELEYSDEIRTQFKSMPGCAHVADLGGFMSPPKQGRKWDGTILERKSRGGRMTRDALASDFGTVGAMIAPEFRPYIELLRNSTVLDKLGCTYIGGCNGEQVFPRQDAATVAQSVAEGSQLNPYDQTLGQIKMTPKRVGSRQYYSRLAVIQAVPGWEAMVWNDHAMVLAIYQDEMGINGTGAADQPVGILNQAGINQLIFGGTPTYNNILNFRTQIRKFNVPGQLAFTTTSVGQGRLAYLPAALNGSTVITQGELDAIWKGDEENGEMLGCKAVASQQIPGDILLAGVFSQLLMASWGGIFTTLDNYTRADRDEVAITFNTYFDIAVRHAEAFTRSLDTVNQ